MPPTHSHRVSVEAQQQEGVVVAHDENEDSTGNNKNDTNNRKQKRKMMYSFGLLCFFMITIFQVGNMTVTTSVRTDIYIYIYIYIHDNCYFVLCARVWILPSGTLLKDVSLSLSLSLTCVCLCVPLLSDCKIGNESFY